MVYNAVVIGAGPGGLASVASLCDAGLTEILWIDRDFTGGRLNTLYREISSNTKVGVYIDAVRSSKTCKAIIDDAKSPNPITRMDEIDHDHTCQLSLAGDMVMMLVEGLIRRGVEKCQGEVQDAIYDQSDRIWNLRIRGDREVSTKRIVLATGSHPTPASFHEKYNSNLTVLDLDECMIKSRLPSIFPAPSNGQTSYTIGIIGSSHSGILVCRNIYETSKETHVPINIVNFQRQPIRYAIYRDDGIVYDNTGLKGATADWTKEVMEDSSEENKRSIRQVRLEEGKEDEVYKRYLGECTHLVYAIGYTPSPIPELYMNKAGGEAKRIDQDAEFDMHTSGFHLSSDNQNNGQKDDRVPGLFGCGIAFPEKVEDPEGHVEAAVGLAKFFKFAERVKDTWAKVE